MDSLGLSSGCDTCSSKPLRRTARQLKRAVEILSGHRIWAPGATWHHGMMIRGIQWMISLDQIWNPMDD